MELQTFENQHDEVNGFDLTLTAEETRKWANTKPYWPCSDLAGHKVKVEYDATGLVGLKIDGKYDHEFEVMGNELDALVDDHIEGEVGAFWESVTETPTPSDLQ